MGFMDKLKFWKKKDDFGDLPDFGNLGTGVPKQPTEGGFDSIGLGQQDGSQSQGFPEMPGIDSSAMGPEQPGGFGDLSSGSAKMSQPSQQPSFASPPPMEAPNRPFSAPPMPRMQAPVPVEESSSTNMKVARDVEIVSYKLDTLKSAIDSINQRLSNIERLAFESVNQQRNYNQDQWQR